MAKEILYGIEARNALVRGVDQLADTVKRGVFCNVSTRISKGYINTFNV